MSLLQKKWQQFLYFLKSFNSMCLLNIRAQNVHLEHFLSDKIYQSYLSLLCFTEININDRQPQSTKQATFFKKLTLKKGPQQQRFCTSVGRLLRDRTVVTKQCNRLLQIYLDQAYQSNKRSTGTFCYDKSAHGGH